MKSKNSLCLLLLIAPLTGCGSFDGVTDHGNDRPESVGARPAPASSAPISGVRDGVAVLGPAFLVDGIGYTPADVTDYDDVGYASWYGAEFGGRPTANGERFNPDGISAAHKTLPLPSYVEVTALDTGRTILVRVNDRGPMDNNRVIDLSQGAAAQLGILGKPAAVRVRRVNPPESERAQLRAGQPVTERLATPENLLAILRSKVAAIPPPRGVPAVTVPAPRPVTPAPERGEDRAPASGDRFIVERSGNAVARAPRSAAAPVQPAVKPVAESAGYVVQVAAFSTKARADAAARKSGGTVAQGDGVWRVRLGPYADEKGAQAALANVRAKGFGEARIMREK